MELGLSLGDASKPLKFLQRSSEKQQVKKKTSFKNGGLGFCMALGLNSYSVENQERVKTQNESRQDDDGDDEDDQIIAEGVNSDNNSNNNQEETPFQLDLLPLIPVPRRISFPWSSSDNGSSENGSSGNLATKGLELNRIPTVAAAAEEVSSANSVGSEFRFDFGVYRSVGVKRDIQAAGDDVVEAEGASSRASDDDENALDNRKKLRLSKEQSAFLEETFKEHNTLNPKQKLALAKQLNLRPRQVEVWFQNRRARTKLKQTEVDCEYLKRCCETLTDENRRLQKELQELRAVKVSNPFYVQSPATTLTMCPSCERVATAAPPSSAAVGRAKVDIIAPRAIPLTLSGPNFFPFSQNSPIIHPHRPAAS